MFYKKTEGKEAAKSYFKGIWAAFPTTLTANGDIDEAGIRANVDMMIDKWKLSGLMFNGAVGEFWALTIEEQKRFMDIMVDAVRGRCGLIAMTNATSVREVIGLVHYAEKAGVDFASPFSPYFPKAMEKGIYNWFKEVTDNTDIGLWVIDTGLAGPHLSLELTEQLIKLPNIVGLKTQRGVEHFRAVKKIIDGRIVLSDPHEASFLERMKEGQQVFMSSPAPMLMQWEGYTPIVDYYEAAKSGDWAKAEKINASLEPIRHLYERYLSKDMFQGTIAVPLIKAWAERLGLKVGPVRPPMVDLTQQERDTINRELDAFLPKSDRRAVA